MIVAFCIGFFVGVASDVAYQWWQGRKIFMEYKEIIEPAMIQIFEEEEKNKK